MTTNKTAHMSEVAKGEPQRVYCPGCSEAGDADRAVYHMPPICAPTAAPVVTTPRGVPVPCPDGIEGCEVLHTVTPSEAARDAALKIAEALKPYFTNNCTAAEQANVEAATVGMISEVIVPILCRHFPSTKATQQLTEIQACDKCDLCEDHHE